MPLTLLPLVIGQVVDAWSSIGRLQDFLIAEEQNEDFLGDMEGEHAISMEHADFIWERTITQDPDKNVGLRPNKKQIKEVKDAEKVAVRGSKPGDLKSGEDSRSTLTQVQPFKLHDLELSIGHNELIAVIGGVGSSKSSLLAALAGDMRRTNGSVILGATRAFCP